jgi:hypothetical protein
MGEVEYLEITKGESTPAEGVSLRERQGRAVKCSVVRGEPVDQVRGGYDHDRIIKTCEPITWAAHASLLLCPLPPSPSRRPFALTTLL